MNYSQIREMDISNGNGVGVSLFVSGCPIHCKDCFNQVAWDFNVGKPFTPETMMELRKLYMKPYIKRFTILGGEPMADQNIPTVNRIISQVAFDFDGTDKKIWIYTGYTLEQIKEQFLKDDDLGYLKMETIYKADYLVDGPFISEEKDLSLKFRGSRNQRIINLKTNEVIR